MRYFQIVLTAAVLSSLTLSAPAAAQSPDDILVVVNSSSNVNSISAAELRDIFLKKRSHWRAGGQAIPIHASENSALRHDFRQRLLEMTSAEEEKYWSDRRIKSGTQPPVEFSNTLRTVFKLNGAVSYVYRSDYKEGIAKVVLVIPAS
ncbi:MAG: hypothetical protein R6V85_11900 [Polyangia bacterium]